MKKMAIVRNVDNILYLQWYDAIAKKIVTKSTGMTSNETNYKKAEAIAKKMQVELTSNRKKLRRIGIQKITIAKAFEHFLSNNSSKHLKTVQEYKWFRSKFYEYFDKDLSCISITKLSVENFLRDIKKMSCSKNTIHSYGKQLNHFVNFLFEYNYTPMFKINREVKTRPEIKEKIIFTDEHITAIFKGLKRKNENFRTAVYILFYTGLRSSDVLTISSENIDIKKKTISYYSPKRKRYREIVFHKDLVSVLKTRLKKMSRGRILLYNSTENIGKAVHRYFEDLEIDGYKYSARTFRKTFITLCRSRYNMDASVVRELVGHEHTNTTDRYYNQISIDRMSEELKKFKRPVFRKKKTVVK
jgi:integrase